MDALMERLKTLWKLVMANGIINVVLGLGVFFPVLTHDQVTRLFAIVLLIGAVVVTAYTLKVQPGSTKLSGLTLAALRLVTALLLLFHPLDNYLTLHVLLAIYFGLEGALAAGEAARVKNIKVLFVPFAVLAATGIICSALIWLYFKGGSYATLSALLALALIVRGAVGISTALTVKNYPTATPEPPSEAEPTQAG